MIRSLFAIVALVAAHLAIPAAAQDYDLFKTYSALRMPRSAVPIGSRWIERSGPTGSATAADNVEITTGLSSLNFTKNTRADISLSLASLIGLTHNDARQVRIDLANLEIHRVRDMTKLAGLTAGQRFVYAAVKARTITITGNRTLLNTVRANAPVNGLPVVASADAGSTSSLSLNGADLFVAYQLMEMRTADPKVTTIRHRGQPATINRFAFKFCKCTPDPGEMVLLITDLATMSPDGTAETLRKPFRMEGLESFEFTLPPRFIGNTVERNAASLRYDYQRPCIVVEGSTTAHCFPANENTLTLTTTAFTLKPFEDRRATF